MIDHLQPHDLRPGDGVGFLECIVAPLGRLVRRVPRLGVQLQPQQCLHIAGIAGLKLGRKITFFTIFP